MKRATAAANVQIASLLGTIAGNLRGSDQAEAWPSEIHVRQAWTDLAAWDHWLASHRASMDSDEFRFHEITLRWAKFVVKQWRIALATGKARTFAARTPSP